MTSPNPTNAWNLIPVFGVYLKADGVTPEPGSVQLTLTQRVNRVDGRVIHPEGAKVTRTIGEHESEAAIRDAVRNAWRAADEATVVAAGGTFDGAAWDARWNVMLTGAVFASFPASDDPDIVQTGYQVKVEEKLNSGAGKSYFIQPLLSDLASTPPGINLGLIDVPPGSPTVPAPIYQKNQPGGVAALDAEGFVVNADGSRPSGGGGGAAVTLDTDGTLTVDGTTVEVATDAQLVAAVAAIDFPVDSVNGRTGAVVGLAEASTVATDLAANSTADRARANHTGTQTSGTISDFTEAVQDAVAALLGAGSNITLAYDDAANTLTVTGTGGGTTDPEAVRDAIGVALVGVGNISIAVDDAGDTITISTAATANSTDAALRDRATHTGAQAISTVTGLQTALDGKAEDGDVTAAVAAHEAATNPHPTYLTQTEADALYASLGSTPVVVESDAEADALPAGTWAIVVGPAA